MMNHASLLSRLHELNARLDEVLEFGIVSVGTAKKVLRGLAKDGGGKPHLLRPDGLPATSFYFPCGSTMPQRRQIVDMLWPKQNIRPKAHTVLVPRETAEVKRHMAGVGQGMAANNPLAVGIHEHGHAGDHLLKRYAKAQPKVAKRFQDAMQSGDTPTADKLGKKLGRTAIRVERRANKNVLAKIAAHGTPQQATTWKHWANRQMKEGYRNPMYQNAALATGADTLSKKKALLRELPMLRSRFTNLASRLAALSLSLSNRHGECLL